MRKFAFVKTVMWCMWWAHVERHFKSAWLIPMGRWTDVSEGDARWCNHSTRTCITGNENFRIRMSTVSQWKGADHAHCAHGAHYAHYVHFAHYAHCAHYAHSAYYAECVHYSHCLHCAHYAHYSHCAHGAHYSHCPHYAHSAHYIVSDSYVRVRYISVMDSLLSSDVNDITKL
jgi:hypothetical protein